MKLTQDEANARLNSGQNAINIIHKQLYADRARGIKLNVPPTIRALIGITANRDGMEETARNFEVSRPLVTAASNGRVISKSTAESREDKEVADRVKSDLKKASAEAIARALSAMQAITPDKLDKCEAKDAAAVANHMASVYDKLSNKQAAISGSGATVIIYSPREKREDEFESIDIEAHVAS